MCSDTDRMEFQAVKPGQGTPRSRPWRGLIQATAILFFALVLTFGAFAWMMQDALRTKSVHRAIAELTLLAEHGASRAPKLLGPDPARFLTDPQRPVALGRGPLPQDFASLFEDGGDAATRPQLDPWQRSYYIEFANSAADAGVTLRCISAGPNGIVETDAASAAPSGDDLLIARTLPDYR